MNIDLLLVEDDQDFVNLASVWLSRSRNISFHISHARSLREALALTDAATFDVILADLNLADSSGCDTVNQLRERRPAVPIVAISASDSEETMYQTVIQGAQDFIDKQHCGSGRLISTILFAIARQFNDATKAVAGRTALQSVR